MDESWLDRWVREHPWNAGGVSTSLLCVRVAHRFMDVRVMGLAAEMTYYAVLSLLPLTAAIGASLGFLDRLAGPAAAREAEAAILRSLGAVFSAEATADVIIPLVEGLLRQERTGFALGSFLVSLFFASRVFRSAIDTLDTAYRTEERRGTLSLWARGMLFAVCAVLVVTAVLGMVVLGPLLGGGRAIADALGMGTVFEVAWDLAQGPVVFAIATAFLALLYYMGPNVENTWRDSLPGAVFGTSTIVLVAVAFRTYLEATGLQSPRIDNASDAVSVALQVIGVLMAMLFWLWLSTMGVLIGAVFNAELARLRPLRKPG